MPHPVPVRRDRDGFLIQQTGRGWSAAPAFGRLPVAGLQQGLQAVQPHQPGEPAPTGSALQLSMHMQVAVGLLEAGKWPRMCQLLLDRYAILTAEPPPASAVAGVRQSRLATSRWAATSLTAWSAMVTSRTEFRLSLLEGSPLRRRSPPPVFAGPGEAAMAGHHGLPGSNIKPDPFRHQVTADDVTAKGPQHPHSAMAGG
jgi:hypothetical protein